MRPKLARPSKHADEQYVSLSYIESHHNLHLIFDVFLISDSATIFVSRRDQHDFVGDTKAIVLESVFVKCRINSPRSICYNH